jgi:hypothetical protein
MIHSIALLVLLCAAVTMGADLNVRDFGARGDAETDDTDAFQKALDAAGKIGCRVDVPAGRYAIKGHLGIPQAVTLRGTFESPARTTYNEGTLAKETGSILLAYEGKGDDNATPFITLHDDSHVRGLIIYYPEQTNEIIAYPWTIRGMGDNCTITAMLIVNPYNCVDFGTKPCGRHYINGLYAQALHTGLFIDKCFDVGRVENVHFWPFWKDDKALHEKVSKSATAFKIARTDWEYMSNCFAIFYSIGFHFIANADGGGNVLVLNSGSDIGPVAVKADNTQAHSGVSFTNCQFMATVETSADNHGPLKFTACGFWGIPQTAEHARLRGKGNVTFENCHFTGWAQSDKNAPCIRADAGGLTMHACEFVDRDKPHIALGEGVESAIVVANRFRSPARIDNKAKGDVQIGLNTGGTAR